MAESGEKSLYEESLEEGAKAINKKTGKPIEGILEEAKKENIEKHAQARGGTLPENVIAESENNWARAIRNVLNRIRGSEK